MTDSTTATDSTANSAAPPSTVWACVSYADAHAGIEFLATAFGFVPTLVVGDDDPTVVQHAELLWPEGGGVMCGTGNRPSSQLPDHPAGRAWVYVVTADPVGVHDRAVAAGAAIVRPIRDEDYGSTGFTAADPEGNVWSFGTYRGTPATN